MEMKEKKELKNNTVEIRWHGRGGQGAKTACLLLADAAFSSGKYVQGFPEYGPERMGAPITAYNRISDHRCTVHSNIYNPDYVAVVDETLLQSQDVTQGLSPDGARLSSAGGASRATFSVWPELSVLTSSRISSGVSVFDMEMLASVTGKLFVSETTSTCR